MLILNNKAQWLVVLFILTGAALMPVQGAVNEATVTGPPVCEQNPREATDICYIDQAQDPSALGSAGDTFVFHLSFNEQGILLGEDVFTSIHLQLNKVPYDDAHRPVFVDDIRMVLTGKNGEPISENVSLGSVYQPDGCRASVGCGAGIYPDTPEFDGMLAYGATFNILTSGDPAIGFRLSLDDAAVIGGNLATRFPSQLIFHTDAGSVTGTPMVRCLGDINNDSHLDIAVILPDGSMFVRDTSGMPISGRIPYVDLQATDVEVMEDINKNGAPELVLLRKSPADALVNDSLTGRALSRVKFNPKFSFLDLELVDDQTGNDIPELAKLGQGSVKVEVKDALTEYLVNSVWFGDYVFPKDLEIYPDLNANDSPELAVLGDNKDPSKADKIEIRDLNTGNKVQDIWLGKEWKVKQQELIADNNANGYPEAAVLRIKNDNSKYTVLLRDTKSREWLGTIYYDPQYPPIKLLTIGDINGNGADEVVVFGRRFDERNQKAQVKDSKSRATIKAVFFDKNFVGQDIATCADINGNGAEELVMLGRRASDGKLRAIVKDAKTGERLGVVNF